MSALLGPQETLIASASSPPAPGTAQTQAGGATGASTSPNWPIRDKETGKWVSSKQPTQPNPESESSSPAVAGKVPAEDGSQPSATDDEQDPFKAFIKSQESIIRQLPADQQEAAANKLIPHLDKMIAEKANSKKAEQERIKAEAENARLSQQLQQLSSKKDAGAAQTLDMLVEYVRRSNNLSDTDPAVQKVRSGATPEERLAAVPGLIAAASMAEMERMREREKEEKHKPDPVANHFQNLYNRYSSVGPAAHLQQPQRVQASMDAKAALALPGIFDPLPPSAFTGPLNVAASAGEDGMYHNQRGKRPAGWDSHESADRTLKALKFVDTPSWALGSRISAKDLDCGRGLAGRYFAPGVHDRYARADEARGITQGEM